MGRYDVIVYGPGGARLDKGDTVTGADTANVYMQNGIVKYTFAETGPGPAGWLYRWDGDSYERAFTSTGADHSFFVTDSGNSVYPSRITVIGASTDEVELAYEWDSWNVGSVTYRDWVGAGAVNYPISSSSAKTITTIRLVKTAIMRRGREGVFVGWHSDPRVSPLQNQIPSQNNATEWGERELGTGGGNAVTFSSAGVSVHHPDFGANSIWGASYPTSRHASMGIDDATVAPYSNADHSSHQHAGYPAEQSTGPWWVADLHASNATTFPFCRYVVLRQRLETFAFQFTHDGAGFTVIHYVNEAHDAANIPFRSMVFLGAFPYVSSDLTAEPVASLRAAVENRAHPTDFELSGQAELEPETTTIAEVRDTMTELVEGKTPTVMTNLKFTAHREDGDFRAWCEANAGAAFRRFSIRDTFDTEGPLVSTPDLREMRTTLECAVAYPKRGPYRDDAATGRPLLDLHDVIRSDLHAIRVTIGMRGYAALETDGVNAAVVGEDWSVDDGDACLYSVLRLRTMYREDPL